MTEKNQCIDEILDMELKMFSSVNAQPESECLKHPDQFKLHRRAQFLAWSKDTLASYFKDLKDAEINGENLMTIKYARMDHLISARHKSPLVRKIVEIQLNWQREMFKKYPFLMKGARVLEHSQDSFSQTSFETYLKGELESYSEHTLQLLYRNIRDKLSRQINMAEEIYENLVQSVGYSSLKQAEKILEKKEWEKIL